MNPITSPGMYARSSGITHAITGPIASSSSSRHGPDAQTRTRPSTPSARSQARTGPSGETLAAGRRRRVKPPKRAPGANEVIGSGLRLASHPARWLIEGLRLTARAAKTYVSIGSASRAQMHRSLLAVVQSVESARPRRAGGATRPLEPHVPRRLLTVRWHRLQRSIEAAPSTFGCRFRRRVSSEQVGAPDHGRASRRAASRRRRPR